MRGLLLRFVVALVALLAVAPATAAAETTVTSGDVYATVSDSEVVLGNGLAERRWSRGSFLTTELTDKRAGGLTWSHDHRDFTLWLAAAEVGSENLRVRDAVAEEIDSGGVRVTMTLVPATPVELPGIATITRVAEAYPGVAGFRTQTTIDSQVPLALTAATLDEAAVGAEAEPTITALRAGADWREPGYTGPPPPFEGAPPPVIGDPHAGTWRDSRSAAAGDEIAGPAQWISTAAGDRSLFMSMERNDSPSSRASYDGETASVGVDYGRDIANLGPFEEQAHVENPLPQILPGGSTGRFRIVRPGEPFAFEAVFTGFADHEGDEPWQFHKYLTQHRLTPYAHDITFNSNGTDSNRISTGAKDDLDFATIQEVAPIAKAMGIETFILDDGWQAISGDWQPDSADFPEPRHASDPAKFPHRFPDSTFTAVREEIAPMKLGLWMSPMHFNPKSATLADHPEWVCTPLGQGTNLYNTADPDSSSNEAGIGAWGPDAIPHVESRIRDAIENWGVSYFKFDFLHFFDCAGQGDAYEFKEAFVAMLDRLRADHPEVTLQIDETNDYRLFPYESVTRGPSWFQNGSPEPDHLLHNLWNLSGYVPSYSIGQHFLGGRQWERYPVDTLMAAALPGHMTFFSDLRGVPAPVVEEAAEWTDFYRENRDLLGGMVYPLLADPLERGWTALQPWDPERGEGALLAFRQGADSATQRIALENVPAGRTFELFEGPTGAPAGTATSAELSEGIEIELAEKETAKVLLIKAVPCRSRILIPSRVPISHPDPGLDPAPAEPDPGADSVPAGPITVPAPPIKGDPIALARCLKKAKKIDNRKKRRKAIERCIDRHGANRSG